MLGVRIQSSFDWLPMDNANLLSYRLIFPATFDVAFFGENVA